MAGRTQILILINHIDNTNYQITSPNMCYLYVGRAREEQLVASNKAVLSDLSAEYLKEKQGMLAEFTEAQELLKDKISAMVLM